MRSFTTSRRAAAFAAGLVLATGTGVGYAATTSVHANAKLGAGDLAGKNSIVMKGSISGSLKGKITVTSVGGNSRFVTTAVVKSSGGAITLKGNTRTGGVADPAQFYVRGTWAVMSASGKYKGSKGSLKVSGVGQEDFSATTLKFSGKLSR